MRRDATVLEDRSVGYSKANSFTTSSATQCGGCSAKGGMRCAFPPYAGLNQPRGRTAGEEVVSAGSPRTYRRELQRYQGAPRR